MSCIICKHRTDTSIANAEDCVETALKSLHRHFAEYKKVDLQRQQELASIQKQNDKLRRIVELLQKQQKDTHLAFDEKNQRNASATPNQSNNFSDENINVEIETPSKLNTAALDCDDDLLNSSPLLLSPQNNGDIIAESEITHNLRAKRIARKKLEAFALNNREKSPLKDLNCNDAESIPQEFNKSMQWISKLPTPKDNGENKLKKHISLSLRKKEFNLKQTKLHFDSSRSEKDFVDKMNPTCKTNLAPSKSALSWILNGRRNTSNTDSHVDLFKSKMEEQNDNDETLWIPSTSNDLSCDKSLVLIPPESPEIIILDETCNTLMDTNLNSKNQASLHAAKRIKTEKLDLEELHRKAEELFTKAPENMEMTDSDDSFNVRPIIIKEESVTPKKNIKQRFNIECPDCEEFFSNDHQKMSDDEIRTHLNSCRHYRHKHQTRLTQTPEGFWNPMITAFDKDDPRNEVLIDNRFMHIKRNINN